MSYWDERVALITGGAQGIGKVIATLLAKEKVKIVITDINEQALINTEEEIKKSHNTEILILTGDVSKRDVVENWFNRTMEKFGRIDFLINNAGITRDGLIIRMKEEDWESVININLKGSFLCAKQAAKLMMKSRFGRIVNISSVVGVYGNAGQVNYSASKAGLIGLTKTLAKELASRNILVNAVAPGFIETEMTKNLPENYIEEIKKRIPLARLGLPLDVANLVKFLLSQDASYITGQIICIDGGLVI
ncbi:MAG: 3-oxoacyl-[acyl-carrier-protein] reductase [Candidatus Hydrogenedentota bacterium]